MENIQIYVFCSLEEIFSGASKTVEIFRIYDGIPQKKVFKVNAPSS